jgi:hypothetical protein
MPCGPVVEPVDNSSTYLKVPQAGGFIHIFSTGFFTGLKAYPSCVYNIYKKGPLFHRPYY